MCKWHGGSYEGNVPVKLARPRSDGQQVVYVDPCIQKIVQALNDAGLQTLNCCCGHGQRPGSIIMADGREILIAPDWLTARKMDDGFPALTMPPPYSEEACPGHVASENDAKVCGRCGIHIDSLRPPAPEDH